MLRVYITPDGQQPYLLSFERAHISVGTAEDNDVRLQAQGVSGRHFRVRHEAAGVVLEDAGSRNGTYVNGRKVNGSQVLLANDEIRIVGYRLRVTAADEGALAADPAAAPASTGTRSVIVGAEPPAEVAGVVAEQEPPAGFDAAKAAAGVAPRARAFNERADEAHLLVGDDLRDAWTWTRCGGRVTPAAGSRERALVAVSQVATRKRTRQRLARLAAFAAALVAGGWTAGTVLAGGPGAYAGGLGQQLRAFRADVERKKQTDCAERADKHAAAARAEAQGDPEAAMRQATEGLACVANFPELRATQAEEVVRSLLAKMHGRVVARGVTATRVASDPRGKVVAWARDDGGVSVLDVGRGVPTTSDGAGTVRLLEISDSGERLVALGGGQVQLWNLLDPSASTRRIALGGREGETGASAVSRDGRVLVASGADLRVFQLDTPGARLTGVALAGGPAPASAVVVSADGSRVYAAASASVMGWRIKAGGKADKLAGHGGHAAMITALGLARCGDDKDERWLLSGDMSGELRVVDVRARGKAKPIVLKADGAITALRLTADCRHVIAATARTLQQWDLLAAEPARASRVFQVGGPISAIELDGDVDQKVLVAAHDALAVCDLSDSDPCPERAGHTQAISAMDLAPLTGRAISAGADGTVRLWDIRASTGSGSLQAHPQSAVRALAVGVEGGVLSASGADATLWRNTGVGGPIPVAELPSSDGQPLKAVALSPNPMWAATAADEPSLVVWRVGADGAKTSPQVVATSERLEHLAFSDDGSWLAGVGAKKVACAVSMHSTNQMTCMPLPLQVELYALTFLPGTHRLAVGGADRAVVVYDLDNLSKGAGVGSSKQDLGKGNGAVRVLAASPDGRWLAAGGENADGRLWDMKAEVAAPQKLGGIGETVLALAFSPDGRWLAAASGKQLYAWKLQEFAPAPARVSEELGGTVLALAFGGDGTLLSGGADGKVLAWDLGPEQPTSRAIGAHVGMVSHLAVLSGGDFVVTAGAAPTLHFWPLTARPLYEMATQALGPPL